MRFKNKIKFMFFCIPLLMTSCGNVNQDLKNFKFFPIENLTIFFNTNSHMEYGIASIQKVETKYELSNLPNEYLFDSQNILNYDNYFFEKNNLYLVTIQISGDLLAGISIDNNLAVCHIFQLEVINDKLNNYAFAFSCEKSINITNIETDLINVTSKEYDDLKKMYDGKIWEGISWKNLF